MVIKNLCIPVFWTKVASALEGLTPFSISGDVVALLYTVQAEEFLLQLSSVSMILFALTLEISMILQNI